MKKIFGANLDSTLSLVKNLIWSALNFILQMKLTPIPFFTQPVANPCYAQRYCASPQVWFFKYSSWAMGEESGIPQAL